MMTRQERERLLTEAIWQAYYHGELDELAADITFHRIDGNDHPTLAKVAKAIQYRFEEAKI